MALQCPSTSRNISFRLVCSAFVAAITAPPYAIYPSPMFRHLLFVLVGIVSIKKKLQKYIYFPWCLCAYVVSTAQVLFKLQFHISTILFGNYFCLVIRPLRTNDVLTAYVHFIHHSVGCSMPMPYILWTEKRTICCGFIVRWMHYIFTFYYSINIFK